MAWAAARSKLLALLYWLLGCGNISNDWCVTLLRWSLRGIGFFS
uniref:Uncharacterized protein n=1 Tax=Arundo donax TaxID=35708 RepID=A0A0A9B6A3_ARUDO